MSTPMDESQDKTPPTLYLIDGSAYIYRAYHAVRGLSNSTGLPTNATFGFTRMLIKLMADRSPSHVAMVFDAKGPTFRHEQYAEYKANRPPMPDDLVAQLPWIRKVTEAFNLPVFEMSRYEADDLIGTLARQAEENGFRVVMVTGDKDFMQLVTEACTIWDPMKDKVIDSAVIRETFELSPRQMIEVMGLSGDTADNIPGVPGIGQKTAVKLIQTFGNMDGVYAGIDTIGAKKQRENLIANKDQALLSRELVTIDQHAPIEFDPDQLKSLGPDEEALSRLFAELEFRQLQQEYAQKDRSVERQYRMVADENGLKELAERLAKSQAIRPGHGNHRPGSHAGATGGALLFGDTGEGVVPPGWTQLPGSAQTASAEESSGPTAAGARRSENREDRPEHQVRLDGAAPPWGRPSWRGLRHHDRFLPAQSR